MIIDPLTTSFTAREETDLANATLGERPVTAVIYTHSHVDHYGGILGVTTAEDVDQGRVRVLAPEGFMREAVAENLIAGPVMARRAFLPVRMLLPPDPRVTLIVDLARRRLGGPGSRMPTEEIALTGTELDVDGVRWSSSHPAQRPQRDELHVPGVGSALLGRELHAHDAQCLAISRGAGARHAERSRYIQETLDLFGSETNVLFSTHHWPRFGQTMRSAIWRSNAICIAGSTIKRCAEQTMG